MDFYYDIHEYAIANHIHTYGELRKYLLLVPDKNMRVALFNKFIGRFAKGVLNTALFGNDSYYSTMSMPVETHADLGIVKFSLEKIRTPNGFNLNFNSMAIPLTEYKAEDINKYQNVERVDIINHRTVDAQYVINLFPNVKYIRISNEKLMYDIIALKPNIKFVKKQSHKVTAPFNKNIEYEWHPSGNDLFDPEIPKNTTSLYINPVAGDYKILRIPSFYRDIRILHINKCYGSNMIGNIIVDGFKNLEIIICSFKDEKNTILTIRNVPFIMILVVTPSISLDIDFNSVNIYKTIYI